MTKNMLLSKTRLIHSARVVFGAESNETQIVVYNDALWHKFTHKGRAQNVLNFLGIDLRELDIGIGDISELGVIMKGDSFTATRVITVIANTFGFLKNIRVRMLNHGFFEISDEEKNKMWNLSEAKKFIFPEYVGEPNINIKKKYESAS